MAIFLALKSPEVEVIGLTTIYGNVRTTLATRNALHLLEVAGRTDIPVAEGSHTTITEKLRKELGMDEDLPAVLLMGGGEGTGPIEATARALGDSLYDDILGEPIGQVLVICGRNKKLDNKLLSIDWKVPVQEVGNVPYVVENGCGKYSKSPKEIAKILKVTKGNDLYGGSCESSDKRHYNDNLFSY